LVKKGLFGKRCKKARVVWGFKYENFLALHLKKHKGME
jgi:hypothetical protein